MARLILFGIAMTLAIVGMLIFTASHQGILISPPYARVAGTACFMFSGMFWAVYGMSSRLFGNGSDKGK